MCAALPSQFPKYAIRRRRRDVNFEFEAAVARFHADLIVAATGSPATLSDIHLRRCAVAVYRNALDFAAGHPLDPRWGILERIVDEFISRIGSASRTPDAEAALERLTLLRDASCAADIEEHAWWPSATVHR
jgi:hypothetical protein